MNNLTNEERARIFAMYYGCEVQYTSGNREILSHIVSGYTIENSYDLDYKLRLLPLSKITDEHAIEVAKIWKPDYKWLIDRCGNFLMLECEDYIMWFDFISDCFDFEEKYQGEENIEAHGCVKETTSCEDIVEIIDRIRELGYALPYKGQSLFELGIAIDKTLV